MSILLIILLGLCVVGLALQIFKVAVDQKTINIVVLIVLILLICYDAGFIKF
jgi:hypothetical protein